MDYEAIVNQNLDVVYRTALSYCKNTYDAEDIVQNTFTKLLQTDVQFEDSEHIRRWLIRVTINECRNMWKSFWKKNISSLDEFCYEPESVTPQQRELLEEVLRLPPKYRIVIHLYYYEGYHVREIADMLQLSESNVQIRLMRARKKLKEQIKEA